MASFFLQSSNVTGVAAATVAPCSSRYAPFLQQNPLRIPEEDGQDQNPPDCFLTKVHVAGELEEEAHPDFQPSKVQNQLPPQTEEEDVLALLAGVICVVGPLFGTIVTLQVFVSAGQPSLEPVHVSAGSHVAVEARQTVLAVCLASAGHDPLDPVHVSALSQTPADVRQTVDEDSNWQLEEQQSPLRVFPSSHCSPDSVLPLPQAIGVQTLGSPMQV